MSPKTRLRVLIFEANHGGHRYAFVRMLADALAEITDEVIIAISRQGRASDEFRVHLECMPANVIVNDWFYVESTKSWIVNALKEAVLLRKSIIRTKANYVYVPSADGIAQILGILRFLFWNLRLQGAEALLLRCSFIYHRRDLGSKLISSVSKATIMRGPWSSLHLLDPLAYEAFLDKGRFKQVRLMPDPVEGLDIDHNTARKRLGVPIDGRYIGCAGILDERKGINLLINVFAQFGGEGDRLLLAGKLTDSVRKFIYKKHKSLVCDGRLIVIDRYVENYELMLAIAAMDVVCTPYPEHVGSSSIVLRAVATGRPVLGSFYGWIGAMIQRFQLGWTCNVVDKAEFGRTMMEALDGATNFQLSSSAHKLIEFHTTKNFSVSWTENLREKFRLKTTYNIRTWEWVNKSEYSVHL